MPTETSQQVASLLPTRYGGVAELQQLELLLVVRAVAFTLRDLVIYIQRRFIEAASTPL
jgi:hypothetical protein